jgi:acyl-CoA synthetase
MTAFTASDTDRYHAKGWWQDETVGQVVRRNATTIPECTAFVEDDRRMTWRQYDELADHLAGIFATRFEVGERVVVLLPDGAMVHAVFVAAERAGLVAVGIGWRAGEAEITHLIDLAVRDWRHT